MYHIGQFLSVGQEFFFIFRFTLRVCSYQFYISNVNIFLLYMYSNVGGGVLVCIVSLYGKLFLQDCSRLLHMQDYSSNDVSVCLSALLFIYPKPELLIQTDEVMWSSLFRESDTGSFGNTKLA